MPKEVYYFSHDANARTDPKMRQMRSVYHTLGYGWYFMFLEMMRCEENYKLSIQGKYVWNGYAEELDANASEIKAFVEDCISEFKLFTSDGQYFWSESFLKRMELKESKSEKARESANARWNKHKQNAGLGDQPQSEESDRNANASKNDALKERKGKESNIYSVADADTLPSSSKESETKEEPEPTKGRRAGTKEDNAAQTIHLCVDIINYLNEKAGKNFSPQAKATRELISGRIHEGRTLENFKAVIDKKTTEWKGKRDRNGKLLEDYLRPSTLFAPTNFENYLNETLGGSSAEDWRNF